MRKKTKTTSPEKSFFSFRNSLIIIILVAVVFRLITFGNVELGGYDEQMYGTFVKTLDEKGISGIRSLIQQAPNDEVMLKGPPPFRILYIATGLLSCNLFGTYDLRNLAWVSFIFGIGIIILGFLLFRKWFRPDTAFFASLLLIVSPLATALSRRALQDSFFTCIVIACIFFFHQCWARKKNVDLIMLGITLLCGFLTKEAMLFLYPCFAMIAISYWKQGLRISLPKLAIPLIAAPLLYLLIASFLAGSFQTYVQTYIAYSQMLHKNEYNIKFCGGPWFRYIIDFMLLSPLTFLLSIVGMSSLLTDEKDRAGKNLCILFALSGFLIFTFLLVLNIRLVFFLDIPLRALSAIGIIFLGSKINKPIHRSVFIASLIFLVFATDIYQFVQIFVKAEVYDPITAALIQATGFVK